MTTVERACPACKRKTPRVTSQNVRLAQAEGLMMLRFAAGWCEREFAECPFQRSVAQLDADIENADFERAFAEAE